MPGQSVTPPLDLLFILTNYGWRRGAITNTPERQRFLLLEGETSTAQRPDTSKRKSLAATTFPACRMLDAVLTDGASLMPRLIVSNGWHGAALHLVKWTATTALDSNAGIKVVATSRWRS